MMRFYIFFLMLIAGLHAALPLEAAVTEMDRRERDQESYGPDEIEDRVFVSANGHQVRLWRDGKDQWRADVTEDFTGIEHEGLPVRFSEDWSIEKLARQASFKPRNTSSCRYWLHVLLRGDLPDGSDGEGLVYVGSQGLKGGMLAGGALMWVVVAGGGITLGVLGCLWGSDCGKVKCHIPAEEDDVFGTGDKEWMNGRNSERYLEKVVAIELREKVLGNHLDQTSSVTSPSARNHSAKCVLPRSVKPTAATHSESQPKLVRSRVRAESFEARGRKSLFSVSSNNVLNDKIYKARKTSFDSGKGSFSKTARQEKSDSKHHPKERVLPALSARRRVEPAPPRLSEPAFALPCRKPRAKTVRLPIRDGGFSRSEKFCDADIALENTDEDNGINEIQIVVYENGREQNESGFQENTLVIEFGEENIPYEPPENLASSGMNPKRHAKGHCTTQPRRRLINNSRGWRQRKLAMSAMHPTLMENATRLRRGWYSESMFCPQIRRGGSSSRGREPDNNTISILILGEADFSYAHSFVQKQIDKNVGFSKHMVIATEFRGKTELGRIYRKFSGNVAFLRRNGIDVRFGIDATNLHQVFNGKRIRRIYFNCPHVAFCNPYSGAVHDRIVRGFFQSARKVQSLKDRIYIAIPKPKRVSKGEFLEGVGYGLYKASKSAHYKYVKKRDFGPERYPGYEHRQTQCDRPALIAEKLVQYVFEKRKNGCVKYTSNDKKFLKRRSRQGSFRQFYVLPFYETEYDSSDFDELFFDSPHQKRSRRGRDVRE